MKFVSVTKSMNPETFEPVLNITLPLSLHAALNAEAVMGEKEFEQVLGKEFLLQLKENLKMTI